MDYLHYASSSDDDQDNDNDKSKPKTITIQPKRIVANPAPQPSTIATLQLQLQKNTTNSAAIHNKTSNHQNNNNNNNNNQLLTNPLKSQLLPPIYGPSHDVSLSSTKNTLSKGGIATNVQHNMAFDHATFEIQRNSFQRNGVALGPMDDDGNNYNNNSNNNNHDGIGMVVQRSNYGHGRKRFNKDTNQYEDVTIQDDRFTQVATDDDDNNHNNNNNHHHDDDDKNDNQTNKKRKRSKQEIQQELIHDSDDEINYGIWGPPTKEMLDIQNDTLSTLEKVGGVIDSLPIEIQKEREYLKERDRQRGIVSGDGDGTDGGVIDSRENQNFDKMVERKMAHLLPPRIDGEEAKAIEPTTKLHLSPDQEFNYKNESWITPPTELRNGVDFGDVDHHTCYVPKKCTARFLGHNKGVHRIRLFPRTGHLLLSGGLDGKCKVWNVLTKQVCRTYIGHSAAVRDVQFNNDGTKFLSCSFDRFIRLWDTESGQVLGTYTNRRVPYVIKFYPLDDNTFVVGCSDNKIVAYDSTSGEITQEYNHHLAPVNTITFVEDHGMKMVTSSDDKKILVWEWDIGVPIKYISDPTMHSIPAVTMHPAGAYFAGQSLDNQIVVYQGKDKFALQRKKKFSGHLVSGYACDIAISPDGQFICSGDGNGKLFFWDWRRGRCVWRLKSFSFCF